MPDQPFAATDIVARYQLEGRPKVVFVRAATNVYGVTMFVRIKRHWECATPNMGDAAELLRQLSGAEAQIAALQAELARHKQNALAALGECDHEDPIAAVCILLIALRELAANVREDYHEV